MDDDLPRLMSEEELAHYWPHWPHKPPLGKSRPPTWFNDAHRQKLVEAKKRRTPEQWKVQAEKSIESRIENCRERLGMTREQLASLSDSELLRLENFGKKSLKRLRDGASSG